MTRREFSSVKLDEVVHARRHLARELEEIVSHAVVTPLLVELGHRCEVVDEMRRRFDVVIFDTPPLNAATDAVVLGTQVDGVAIVVRAGKTHREVARRKLELFHNLEAKIIGVILNGTGVDLAHEGYSYYHY